MNDIIDYIMKRREEKRRGEERRGDERRGEERREEKRRGEERRGEKRRGEERREEKRRGEERRGEERRGEERRGEERRGEKRREEKRREEKRLEEKGWAKVTLSLHGISMLSDSSSQIALVLYLKVEVIMVITSNLWKFFPITNMSSPYSTTCKERSACILYSACYLLPTQI